MDGEAARDQLQLLIAEFCNRLIAGFDFGQQVLACGLWPARHYRMTERPAGTVTFLFTDIEGSTRLLHELGTGQSQVLAIANAWLPGWL